MEAVATAFDKDYEHFDGMAALPTDGRIDESCLARLLGGHPDFKTAKACYDTYYEKKANPMDIETELEGEVEETHGRLYPKFVVRCRPPQHTQQNHKNAQNLRLVKVTQTTAKFGHCGKSEI